VNAAPAPRMQTGKVQYDQSELAMPRLKLLQGISREVMNDEAGCKAGVWYLTGLGALTKPFTVFPLATFKSRELRVGQGDDARTDCRSNDAETGYGTPGGACAQCPMAKWTPDPNKAGKNRPPACNLQYNFVVYVPEYNSLAMWRAQRTAT